MIIVEFGKKYQGCGKYRSIVGGRKFYRIWLGWIALAWTQFDLKELCKYAAGDNIVWRYKDGH